MARLQAIGDSLAIAGKSSGPSVRASLPINGSTTGSGNAGTVVGIGGGASGPATNKGKDALALYRYISSASPPPQPRVNVYMFGRMVYSAASVAGKSPSAASAATMAARSPLALKT